MDSPNDPHMFTTEPFSTFRPLNRSRRLFHLGRLILGLAAIAAIFAAGLFTGSRYADMGTSSQVDNRYSPTSNSDDITTTREQVIANPTRSRQTVSNLLSLSSFNMVVW